MNPVGSARNGVFAWPWESHWFVINSVLWHVVTSGRLMNIWFVGDALSKNVRMSVSHYVPHSTQSKLNPVSSQMKFAVCSQKNKVYHCLDLCFIPNRASTKAAANGVSLTCCNPLKQSFIITCHHLTRWWKQPCQLPLQRNSHSLHASVPETIVRHNEADLLPMVAANKRRNMWLGWFHPNSPRLGLRNPQHAPYRSYPFGWVLLPQPPGYHPLGAHWQPGSKASARSRPRSRKPGEGTEGMRRQLIQQGCAWDTKWLEISGELGKPWFTTFRKMKKHHWNRVNMIEAIFHKWWNMM
jgi:hypothetical protein